MFSWVGRGGVILSGIILRVGVILKVILSADVILSGQEGKSLQEFKNSCFAARTFNLWVVCKKGES